MSIVHFGWNTPFALDDTAFVAHAGTGGWRGTVSRPQRMPGSDEATASQAMRFERATALLEAGEWSGAFAALGALATEGHTAAARIALMLVQRGAAMFGGSFSATPQERQRWQTLAG